jgi:hypothetical protein
MIFEAESRTTHGHVELDVERSTSIPNSSILALFIRSNSSFTASLWKFFDGITRLQSGWAMAVTEVEMEMKVDLP